MTLSTLKRRKPKKKPPKTVVRCHGHLQFVRGHCCLKCGSDQRIEAAHIRNESDGGTGLKPGDDQTVPLCGGPEGCHAEQHRVGELTFWGPDLEAAKQKAQDLWFHSPQGRRYRRERELDALQ